MSYLFCNWICENCIENVIGIKFSKLCFVGHDFSSSVIPEKDVTVGNLLRISVVQSPTLAKAWNRFGNWCYKWGRTVVDKQSNILTNADKISIDGYIPSELTNKEDIYSILTRIKPPVDEEDIEVGKTGEFLYHSQVILRGIFHLLKLKSVNLFIVTGGFSTNPSQLETHSFNFFRFICLSD